MVNAIDPSMTAKNAKTQTVIPVHGLKERRGRAKLGAQGSNSSRAELLARSEARSRMRDRFKKILVNTLLEGIINITVICLIAVACARIEDETGYDLLAYSPGGSPSLSKLSFR
ncbi:hypothetical protein MCOR25_008607 [Pyricularia grisea]|nr:hypothetical protein MCOR25_008607 [Pyricularia grisea]